MQKNRVKKYGCFFIVFALILTVATFYKMHCWKEVKDYGLFNVKRLYDGLLTFLFPSSANFSLQFPYVSFFRHEYKNAYLYPRWKEPYIAVTLSSIFFPFLILYFIYRASKYLYTQKFKGGVNYKSVAVFSLIFEILLVSSYCFLTERYICEFVPLIFFLLLMFLNRIDNKYVFNCFAILLVCLVFITIQATISELVYFPSGDYDKTWVHILGNIKQILL